MKRVVLLGAIAAWLCIPVAWGEEGQVEKTEKGKGPPEGRGKFREELIKQFDKDGDGKLSEEEMAAAKAAREEKIKAEIAERFKKADTDGNGCISLEEWTAFHMKQRESMKEMKERMRKGGDGKECCQGQKGNNGVGNGQDPAPPGNPPENDGPGAQPGDPGNKGGI